MTTVQQIPRYILMASLAAWIWPGPIALWANASSDQPAPRKVLIETPLDIREVRVRNHGEVTLRLRNTITAAGRPYQTSLTFPNEAQFENFSEDEINGMTIESCSGFVLISESGSPVALQKNQLDEGFTLPDLIAKAHGTVSGDVAVRCFMELGPERWISVDFHRGSAP